ncbi:MAG: hypothetical protein CME19_04865 [Gemmatimonadetes bacterium]|nr:hypothetical protein [Gemmatimonadota bacterium]
MTEHYILIGTRIRTALGTDDKPEVVQLSQFTDGSFQQSFALIAEDGTVPVDTVRPRPHEEEQPFLDRIGSCQAIVLTTANHERYVY